MEEKDPLSRLAEAYFRVIVWAAPGLISFYVVVMAGCMAELIWLNWLIWF